MRNQEPKITMKRIMANIGYDVTLEKMAEKLDCKATSIKGFLRKQGTTYKQLKIDLNLANPRQMSIKNLNDLNERIARMKATPKSSFKKMMSRCESFQHMADRYRLNQEQLQAIFDHHGVELPWSDGEVVGINNPMFRLAFYDQWSRFDSGRRSNFAYRV